MPSFPLHPIDQARIYNVVSTRAYTIGQGTKFLGTNLRGAPIFTTVTNDNNCAVADFKKENMKMSHGHSLNKAHVCLFNVITLGQRSQAPLDKNIPLIGEKARGIGSSGNPYHLQEAQWRRAIRAEIKRVWDWGVYIDDGVYTRRQLTQ